jgi:hypothetical protein
MKTNRPPSSAASRAKKAPPPDPIVNLEMIGDKVKVYSLQNLLRAKRSFKRVEPPLLGDILQPWFERQIQKPGEQLEGITDLWLQNVPEALADRTRLAGLSRGTLVVQVSSSPVRAELDSLLRQGLLRQLQTLSNGAIYRIKTIVDALPFRAN